MLLSRSPGSTIWGWYRCSIRCSASSAFHEPPYAEPHVRWCGRAVGAIRPLPDRHRFLGPRVLRPSGPRQRNGYSPFFKMFSPFYENGHPVAGSNLLHRHARPDIGGGVMNKQDLVRLFAVSTAAVPGLLLSAAIASAQVISSDGFLASVPKAICGPTDHTESGLQGETSQQERFSGDSETAYNCNLQIVGEEPQDTYQGAYSQDGPAYYDVCAYYGTDRGATTGQGIKVIDASDPQHPVVTTQLTDSAAALSPHETVSTNAKTRLLVAGQTTGSNFAVYDISDCRHPVLKGTVNASSTSFHHMGAFAPDGKTFYASQNAQGIG